MSNQDYLLRMIEQFAIFISRIVFKRDAGLFEEAQEELDGIMRDLLDLDPDSVFKADRQRLTALLESEEDEDRLFILGRAIEEKALVSAASDRGRTEDDILIEFAVRFLIKSDRAGRSRGRRRKEIEEAFGRVREVGTSATGLEVMSYYEELGLLDKAEDLLFELLSTPNDRTVARGKTFYTSLLALDDEALRKGNLPRDEVEEGMNHLRTLAGEG